MPAATSSASLGVKKGSAAISCGTTPMAARASLGLASMSRPQIDTDPAVSERYLRAGALFVAVGVEADLLIRAATDLARRFKR